MRRFFAGTAAGLLAAVLFLPVNAHAITAEKAIVMDGTTGQVLYEKDADERSLIASTTKIMTALVVCEQCNVLDRVRIPKEAVGIEGSSMYLQEGEILTVQELLYGLMLSSGNDAATALAIYCGGTVEGFAEMMNDKARTLGLRDTHFVNPHGLDALEHYATARDLAVLACYAMDNPIFEQTVSTKNVRVGQRSLKNHNKLLWQVEGADGVKTGYTKAAGRILVSSATRDGRRVVGVTINDPNDWQDHAELINMAFSDYSVRKVVRAGDVLGTVEVLGGVKKKVKLIATEDFSYAMRDGEKCEFLVPGSGFVYAPIAENGEAGFVYVTIGGKAVGKVSVCYAMTIEQAKMPRKSFLKRLFGG